MTILSEMGRVIPGDDRPMFVLLVPPDWLPAKISDTGIIDKKRIERAVEFVSRKFSAVKYRTEKITHESPVRHHTYSFCLVCLKKIESVNFDKQVVRLDE